MEPFAGLRCVGACRSSDAAVEKLRVALELEPKAFFTTTRQ
jgi:hypothetical protein